MNGVLGMLRIENLKKSYGKNEVLKGIDLTIEKGEVLVIVGPSGGGKTTLLRCINGLEKSEEGIIEINGKCLCNNGKYAKKKQLTDIRKDLGLVFQNFNLFPHMNVSENIMEAPVKVLGKTKNEAREKCNEILRFLALEDKGESYPFELSGGQKQRVAIGRALAMEPKLICFDEPTSALDPSLTGDLTNLIKRLSKENGITMMIITHDMDFASKVATRIISMDSGVLLEKHIYDKVDE